MSGLMNTVQQPASEVATTALLPRRFYQRVGGTAIPFFLRDFHPDAHFRHGGAGALGNGRGGCHRPGELSDRLRNAVVLYPHSPDGRVGEDGRRFESAAEGIRWLKRNPGILHLMLFLAGINLVASMYNAAFPAMVLSKVSEWAMGVVNTVIGISTLLGSILASFMKTPRSRVKAI